MAASCEMGPAPPVTGEKEFAVPVGALLLLLAVESSGAADALADRLPVSLYMVVLGIGAVSACLQLSRHPTPMPWLTIAAWSGFVSALVLSYQRSSLNPRAGAEAVSDALKNLVFLVVCCALAAGLKRWWTAAAAVCVPMALISGLSAANQWLFHNRFDFLGFVTVTQSLGVGVVTARHAGPTPDPNFWGRFLVVGLAFALALVSDARRRGNRLGVAASSGTIGLLLVGIYLTGSRGTFIATAVVVFMYLLLVGVSLRQILIGVPLVGFVALLVPGVASRLLSMVGLAEQGQRAAVDPSLLERLATQRVGLRMLQDRILTGVGPGGYMEAFPDYAAVTDVTLRRVTAPHNLYVGLAAELGLIGLAAWLLVIGAALLLGLRAIRHLSVLPGEAAGTLRPYVASCLAALAGWSVASMFLHLSYVRVILIVVALIGVLEIQSRNMVEHLTLVPSTLEGRAARTTPRRPTIPVVLGAVVGAFLAIGLVVALPRDIKAEAVGVLQPIRHDPYYLDLRSRTAVVPTFAVIVATSGDRVEAQGDPTSGLITVSANGATGAARLDAAKVAAAQQLETTGLGRLYRISWGQVTERTAGAPWLLAAGAGSAGAALSGATVLYIHRSYRTGSRQRRHEEGQE
jgi:O-antigen ligase